MYKNTTPPRFIGNVTIPRALTLKECYIGPDLTFAEDAMQFIEDALQTNPYNAEEKSLSWSIANIPAELHEFFRDDLLMETNLTSPTSITVGTDTDPKDPYRPTPLYPAPPLPSPPPPTLTGGKLPPVSAVIRIRRKCSGHTF